MAKSLSERIAQRVSTRQPSRTGKNRASFLAVRDDVKKALDDGWPVKVIWDTLRDEGKIEFVVERELDEVAEFVVVDPAHHHSVQLGPPETGGLRRLDAVEHLAEIAGFNYNPKPNKEDLL